MSNLVPRANGGMSKREARYLGRQLAQLNNGGPIDAAEINMRGPPATRRAPASRRPPRVPSEQ